MTEAGINKNRILAELAKSEHGNLHEYIQIGRRAAHEESEFFAHLISWNHEKGSIRDAKIALPVVSLMSANYSKISEFKENSLAHIAKLGPRELERTFRFAKSASLYTQGYMRTIIRLIHRYLAAREKPYRGGWSKWDKIAVQHRKTLANLYALTHAPCAKRVGEILFNGENPAGSVFADVANLKNMSAKEAAATIIDRKIPFLIALGALGQKSKDEDLVLALISRMSATELTTNTKMLMKLGVNEKPSLRAAYQEGLAKVAKSKKNVLKTTRAAEHITDEKLKANLQAAQEKQIKNMSIKGDWLVLADKSGSMSSAIEAGKLIASTLAKFAEGRVLLVFFDEAPSRVIDATGKTYDEIKELTRRIVASGSTCIGCGLEYALSKGMQFDGIAIVSDGGENRAPAFGRVYEQYYKRFGTTPSVYFYHLRGDSDNLSLSCQAAGISMQKFELRSRVDYYSLPNIVQTMRVSQYSLVEEVMESKLWTVDEVFRKWQQFEEKEELITV